MTAPRYLRHNSSFMAHVGGSVTGAINDNFFRLAFTIALQRIAGDEAATSLKPLLGMLFIAPMFVLAPTAGSLGDRLPAKRIMLLVRGAELPLVILAAIGLWLGSIPIMLCALAGFGIQSAFFSPIKYAFVPDIAGEKNLAKANGVLGSATTLAILVGTALIMVLDPHLRNNYLPFLADWSRTELVVTMGLIIALTGLLMTTRVQHLPAHNPQAKINAPCNFAEQIRALNSRPGLWAPVLSLAGFWGFGAIAQLGMIGVGAVQFGFDEFQIGLLVMIPGIGIAIGSAMAPLLISKAHPAGLPVIGGFLAGSAFLAAGIVAMGVVPPAAETIAGLGLIERMTSEAWWFAALCCVAGVGAGWWLVSCNTLLQQRSDAHNRALVYSAENIFTNFGMFAGFGLLMLCAQLSMNDSQSMTVVGCLMVVIAVVVGSRYPLQIGNWIFTLICRLCWNVRIRGDEKFPSSGGCVVICNHVSFADGPILASHLPRRAHYLVHANYMRVPVIKQVMQAGGCLPVSDGGRGLVKTINAAIEAAKSGDVVVIFPEGKLSRSGQLDEFKSGVEKIARRANVPVVPCHLSGLSESFLSKGPRRRRWLFPRRRTVHLTIGDALPAETPAFTMRDAVMRLGYEAFVQKRDHYRGNLASRALRAAKRHPLATAVQDIAGKRSRYALTVGALAIGKHFALDDNDQRVGVVLPPSAAGILTNLALAIDGRCAVNLNHTVGNAGLERMGELAELRTTITARAYYERIGEPALPGRIIFLEDIAPKIGLGSKIWHSLRLFLLPTRFLCKAQPSDCAAVLFSSGSTGDPKGIMLSHGNIIANVDACVRQLGLKAGEDTILTPLPLFHSFGLTIGTWLPLIHGLGIAAHPDPTDSRGMAKLAEKSLPSFLLGTPTFVRSWMRRIDASAFARLRFGVVGAEKCPAELSAAFMKKFNAPLLEGYGATELGPVVSVNSLEVSDKDVTEIGHKAGSVGRPLAGVHIDTVDPDSKERLPVGSTGLLIVRSPALMQGYIGRDDLTEKTACLGGYNTGDIGYLDEQGFVHLTGRLARFAKIGGEMVPLDTVEAAMQDALEQAHGEDSHNLAVACVQDPSKGERLVVLYETLPCNPDETLALLSELPAIFKPKTRDFHQVDTIPVLGTGKRDLKALKQLATDLAS